MGTPLLVSRVIVAFAILFPYNFEQGLGQQNRLYMCNIVSHWLIPCSSIWNWPWFTWVTDIRQDRGFSHLKHQKAQVKRIWRSENVKPIFALIICTYNSFLRTWKHIAIHTSTYRWSCSIEDGYEFNNLQKLTFKHDEIKYSNWLYFAKPDKTWWL